ncbi:hypothetical protein NCCP2716_08210 [Sporosarcina sp. NCCP-2716]|uniref:VOC family protein n=1 Tax=Sporosarcina sp. NCCP-2716 TaxID=2943679 RepID=UPI00203F58D7|nr:VOC family protein [Sporosarcina sp. NCCP-2716]GKV68323.1 hypothetical protein NCCP2716_08210 [Sporosarcina sp. NCCP-2716]
MKLDHAVWFTEYTPSEIAAQHEGAVEGGRHEQWGTYNALKYLSNGYIEWLAVEDAGRARQSEHPLVRQLLHDLAEYGGGWGTLCFSTDDIEALDTRLQAQGLTTSGVMDASRKTSSGTVKKWKMLFVSEDITDDLPSPFFIQWEEDEETRRAALRQEGAIRDVNESERITECVLAAADPALALGRWSHLLGAEPETDDSFTLNGIHFRFTAAADGKSRMAEVATGQTGL